MTWPAPDGIDPEEAFPADWVRSCTERSLRNLGLDTIDVQQFHVWSDEWVGRGTWLEGIEAMKAEGKIRAFGVSINDHQPSNAIRLIESGAVDTVQVIYNVFDQSPEDELLPACEQHGIGVLARVPFDEGALTGTIGADTEFPDGDFRNRYFRDDRKQQVADHVQSILDDGVRSPSVTAATDLRSYFLAPWEFRPFLEEHPEAALKLLTTLARRLRAAQGG